jgi:hypothetical protein
LKAALRIGDKTLRENTIKVILEQRPTVEDKVLQEYASDIKAMLDAKIDPSQISILLNKTKGVHITPDLISKLDKIKPDRVTKQKPQPKQTSGQRLTMSHR